MRRNPRLSRAAGVCLVTALGLTACVDTSVDPQVVEEVQFDGEEVRLAHVYDANHPVEVCGVTAANEALDGTDVRINSYPGGQLGSEGELLEQVQAGSLEMAIAGPSFHGIWEEEAEVFDAAYLFTDVDHMERTVNGPVAEDIFERLRENYGLDVHATWYLGTRHATGNTEVIDSGDMAGQAFRVPEAPLFRALAEVLGASATFMSLDEVYLGLQQGTIDAQENPAPTISANSLYEVQEYLNLTHHIVAGVMVTGSEAALSVLEDHEQEALREALQEGAEATRDCVEAEEEELFAEWEETGAITVNDDVDLDHFRDRAAEVIPEQFSWGELYLQIQEEGQADD